MPSASIHWRSRLPSCSPSPSRGIRCESRPVESLRPNALAPPSGSDGGQGRIAGGLIFFGGGVPIYKSGKIVGGLGVSGDTSCTDHEIAKRVRSLAGLNPPGGEFVDDISYSSVDGASVFTHPFCMNTYRNGTFIGTEAVATGY